MHPISLLAGVRKELLLFYNCTSVHFCICTFVYLCFCICTFIHLMWDKRPCWDDPLNITPRWAGRKLTTGQQSHRRSRPMFMFNPDPASNVQMPQFPIWLKVCKFCATFAPVGISWSGMSDPMSGQMGRLPIKFAIKPPQHEVTLHHATSNISDQMLTSR